MNGPGHKYYYLFAERWVLVGWTGVGEEGLYSVVSSKNILTEHLDEGCPVTVKHNKGQYAGTAVAIGMIIV